MWRTNPISAVPERKSWNILLHVLCPADGEGRRLKSFKHSYEHPMPPPATPQTAGTQAAFRLGYLLPDEPMPPGFAWPAQQAWRAGRDRRKSEQNNKS